MKDGGNTKAGGVKAGGMKAGGKLKHEIAGADEDDIINTPATTLKGGLIVQDISAGSGASAENGKTVRLPRSIREIPSTP